MSNTEHLNSFLHRVTSDVNLTTTHIGVCAALVVTWASNGFKNPFSISRKKLMNAAKIKSTSTYHRIIADLVTLKYFRYTPSYHPTKGSEVFISH